jgi:C4-dicarboxylate transporter DctM subunit
MAAAQTAEWLLPALTILAMLIGFLMLGVPIAFSIGATSAIGIVLFLSPSQLSALANIAWKASNNSTLASVPIFILMAEVLMFTGIGSDLFGTLEKWCGRLPGGLAIGTAISSAIFGAVSGTAIGVASILGGVAIPEMRKKGYNAKIACGVVAGASGLGMLIPPSVPMISYGVITETSVGELFMAGIIPGVALCLLYCAYLIFASGKMKTATFTSYTWGEKFKSLTTVLPVLILIVLVIGSIYGGFATCSEAASIGAIGAIVVTVCMRRLTFKNLIEALKKSVKTCSMVILIMVCAQLFSYLLTALNLPQMLSNWIVELGLSKWIVFAIIHVAFLFLGMFFDCGSIFLLTMPVIFPVVVALGFHPVWFAVTCVVNFCIAVVTPPVGLAAYVVKGLAPDVSLNDIVMGALPLLLIDLVMIILLCIFPNIALCMIQ